MSFRDFMRASRQPYMRLAGYLKPYRGRFLLGVLFGALFGLSNGALVLLIRVVVPIVLPDKNAEPFKLPGWLPKQLPEIHPDGATLWQVVLICASIPLL